MDQLGCEIGRRAHQRRFARAVDLGGDAEVHEHRPSGASLDQDVVEGHVTMQDAHRMGVGQGPSHLAEDALAFARWHRSGAPDPFAERFAGDDAHDEVDPTGRFGHREDRHDERVRQSSAGTRLGEEPFALIGTCGQLGAEDLDRHRTIERDVAAEIDHAHAPLPKSRLKRVNACERILQSREVQLVFAGHAGDGVGDGVNGVRCCRRTRCSIRRMSVWAAMSRNSFVSRVRASSSCWVRSAVCSLDASRRSS